MKKVLFTKVKVGEFFRIRGKALWQKFDLSGAQCVSGKRIGDCIGSEIPEHVTPVNARIVVEE